MFESASLFSAGLAKVCHEHGVPLIVDGAHGAHHGLQPGFPSSPLPLGADIVAQSTHKTLSSLGQSSMLHCRGPRVSHDRISSSLRMLQVCLPPFGFCTAPSPRRNQFCSIAEVCSTAERVSRPLKIYHLQSVYLGHRL